MLYGASDMLVMQNVDRDSVGHMQDTILLSVLCLLMFTNVCLILGLLMEGAREVSE